MLAVGPNGVGKTNLLESLHVATQGFSPRTRHDAQLIRFGESVARASVSGFRAGAPVEATVTLRSGQAKEARLNGARLPSAESLPVPFTGDALEIGFNPEFLKDGLESVDTDEIALRLISPLRPGLLRSEEEAFSYLIMPIRLAG